MMSTNPNTTTRQRRKSTLEQNLGCICRIVTLRDFIYPWSCRETCSNSNWTKKRKKGAHTALTAISSAIAFMRWVVKNYCETLCFIFSRWSCLKQIILCWKNMLIEFVADILCIHVPTQWWSMGVSLAIFKHAKVVLSQLGWTKKGHYKLLYKVMNHFCVCSFPAHTSKTRTFSSYWITYTALFVAVPIS